MTDEERRSRRREDQRRRRAAETPAEHAITKAKNAVYQQKRRSRQRATQHANGVASKRAQRAKGAAPKRASRPRAPRAPRTLARPAVRESLQRFAKLLTQNKHDERQRMPKCACRDVHDENVQRSPQQIARKSSCRVTLLARDCACCTFYASFALPSDTL